ncbi:DUF1707 domain-containing protein [Microbispora sitophila]|uniref:DUF1707 domain-containing protein n=1 Tax=Microbispora sitophila TaxID=2771537 RepID=UPI001D013CAB|nr:DUF1707 domain-containing protein [Microbispora sitophila]
MDIDSGTALRSRPAGAPAAAPRVGAAERDRAVEMLGDAFGAGYLTKEEFDERLDVATRARHRAELDPLLADLPPTLRTSRDRARRRARKARAARLGVRIHAGVYAGASLLMVAVWLVVGRATDFWYPWPIWPILGWGVGVLGHAIPVTLATRARESRKTFNSIA